MPSRRRFLTTLGVSTALATGGCTSRFPSNDVSGPTYPGGTLWVYNTAQSDLSVKVETVDHARTATFENVVPSGETEIREEFVEAPAGTTVTLRAHVETFAEDGMSHAFMPSGGGSEDGPPPQYARLHIPGADGEVNWQSREAGE